MSQVGRVILVHLPWYSVTGQLCFGGTLRGTGNKVEQEGCQQHHQHHCSNWDTYGRRCGQRGLKVTSLNVFGHFLKQMFSYIVSWSLDVWYKNKPTVWVWVMVQKPAKQTPLQIRAPLERMKHPRKQFNLNVRASLKMSCTSAVLRDSCVWLVF